MRPARILKTGFRYAIWNICWHNVIGSTFFVLCIIIIPPVSDNFGDGQGLITHDSCG